MRAPKVGAIAGEGGEGSGIDAVAASTAACCSATIAAAVASRTGTPLGSHCAIGVPTATVVPVGTRISASVPALGALTS